MSYWTKRRKLTAKVKRYLDAVDDSNDAEITAQEMLVQNVQSDEIVSVELDAAANIAVIDNVKISQQNNFKIGNEVPYYAEEPTDPTGLLDFSSDSDMDDADECDSAVWELTEALQTWGLQFKITISAMSGLLKILQKTFPSLLLPSDGRAIYGKKSVVPVVKMSEGGEYLHFGIEKGIVDNITNRPIADPERAEISIQINIDGLPLFKSTNGQFWPILGLVEHFENNVQSNKHPFMIGLYYGKSKPKDICEFLKPFVDEATSLIRSGFTIREKSYAFRISAFICDTPARAFVKSCKGHGAYYGCDKCSQKGVHIGRVTFPELHAELRTDASFANMEQKEHHLEKSTLVNLGIGMISQFPADYMHLVCLGVQRKLIYLWLKGPLSVRLGPQNVAKLSDKLISVATWAPQEFARKPRSIIEFERYKATELRQFCLYTGIVYLAKILPGPLYNNFLLLSVAMRIYLSKDLCSRYAEYAHELMLLFIEHASQLYGNEVVTYNLHGLCHLYHDAKKYGPLDNISAFPFESYLYQLKKLVRKPELPLQQAANRILEGALCTKLAAQTVYPELKQEHHTGNLPSSLPRIISRYKMMNMKNYCLRTTVGDNCVKLKNEEIVIIQNIVKLAGNTHDVCIVYNKFTKVENFFTYPSDSASIGIYSVSELSASMEFCLISSIDKKYVLFPFKKVYIALPLLHL